MHASQALKLKIFLEKRAKKGGKKDGIVARMPDTLILLFQK